MVRACRTLELAPCTDKSMQRVQTQEATCKLFRRLSGMSCVCGCCWCCTHTRTVTRSVDDRAAACCSNSVATRSYCVLPFRNAACLAQANRLVSMFVFAADPHDLGAVGSCKTNYSDVVS